MISSTYKSFRSTKSGKIILELIPKSMIMTPEEKERLDVCLTELAEILFNNTPAEKIETLEGIETTIREQMLAQVSPKIALFLSKNRPELTKVASEI